MNPAAKIIGMISLIIILVAGLALTPTVVEQVQNMQTEAAANWTFTGAEGATALMGLIPFVWVAALLIATVVGLFVLAKGEE